MTTIITAIFGDIDAPKAFEPQSIPCRMLMVTDRVQHPSCQWEVVLGDHYGGSPRLLAKRPKIAPWQYSGDEPWIWVDASMEIISPTFAEEALDSVHRVGMWDHPARDCLYQEAAFSATLPKYDAQQLAAQTEFYAGQGMPRHWGLWAAGLIVHKQQDFWVMKDWHEHNVRWGIQDQVSLPFVMWTHGHRPESLPHHLLDNPWIILHNHRSNL